MRKTIVIALILLTGCSVNLFTSYANPASDEALLVTAKQFMNAKDYTNALLQFPLMSTSMQQRRDVLATWAAAHAGNAGLDFLTLANNIKNIGTTNLMVFLMQNFEHGTLAKMNDLTAAQTMIYQISATASLRTNDENMEMVVIAMANIGTILSLYGDANSDGTVDVGFNPCLVASLPEAAPNRQLQQIGLSINFILDAMTALSANGVSFGPGAVTAATAACTALAGAGPLATYAFCGVYDPTAFTANQILGIRSLINEKNSGVGLGVCNNDIITCHC